MQIKYFVRTTGDRDFNYDIDYKALIDKEYDGVKSFIDALNTISEYDAVLLEDDLVLCKNFKEEIEKVISEYPDTIINFFTVPEFYYTTHYSENFSYNQCTYFPKGLGKLLAEQMLPMYKQGIKQSYGNLLSISLNRLGIPHLIYRPSLVQHIDGKSIFQKTSFIYERNTLYFKDYLDELGIDMIQAFKRENRLKLKELLQQDRNSWYEKYKNKKGDYL